MVLNIGTGLDHWKVIFNIAIIRTPPSSGEASPILSKANRVVWGKFLLNGGERIPPNSNPDPQNNPNLLLDFVRLRLLEYMHGDEKNL